jgi:hypothetical protein|uniref:Uncharacterized protein n=1 Tax=Populus trichocarpa TaxID=3694 RepID=A0A2K1WSR0_POPTR
MLLEREPSTSITITWYLSYKYKKKKISETMFLLQDLNMERSGDCDVATVLHMVIPKQFLVSSEATDAKTHNIA